MFRVKKEDRLHTHIEYWYYDQVYSTMFTEQTDDDMAYIQIKNACDLCCNILSWQECNHLT